MLAGYNIITDLNMADRVQVRFPRSKKSRMRKKWRKDPKNWRMVPREEVMVMEACFGHPASVIMHPVMRDRLLKQLRSPGKDNTKAAYAQYAFDGRYNT